MDIKEKLLELLKKQGFYYMINNNFPMVIAWQGFMDISGNSIKIITNKINSQETNIYTPFMVVGFECIDKKLNNTKLKRALDLINKNVLSTFYIVREKDNGELESTEIKPKVEKSFKKGEDGKRIRTYVG